MSVVTLNPPADPGGTTETVVWNSTYSLINTPTAGGVGNYRGRHKDMQRLVLKVRSNVDVTVKQKTLAQGSTTWRVINGGGSGEVITANNDAQRDFFLEGVDNEITLTAASDPTTWEISAYLVCDRALAQ